MQTRNLKYLQNKISPDSCRHLNGAVRGSEHLSAEPRPDGQWDLIWQDGDRKITLHSRRDPVAEAVRQAAETIKDQSVDGCVIAGFAGLHHLKAIAARLKRNDWLIVIDLDPAMVMTALNFCDLRELDRFNLRCVFIFNPEVEAAKREFRSLLKQCDRFNFAPFIHPSMLRIAAGRYQQLLEELCSEIQLETTDRITRATLAEEWLLNAIDGLPDTLRNPDIGVLKNHFSGHTAIIAAAGPSLNQAMPMLRRLAPDCLLFAVGTALKPLLAADIHPDFIVALDSDPLTLRQLPEQTPENLMLLAAHSVPPAMAARFADHRFSFSFSGMKGFNRRLTAAGIATTVLNVGGTVSLTAIDAALLTGCNSIILCGLDLAVASDGTTHAQNSMYDGCKAASPQLVAVRGNYQEQVLTTPQFAGYIKQMNAYLADMTTAGQAVFYNATDSGAFFDNTVLVKPEDVDSVVKIRAIADKKAMIGKLHEAGQLECRKTERKNFVATTEKQLRQLIRDAAEAEKLCGELLITPGGPAAGKKAAGLDAIDKKIKANPGMDIIEPALENVLLSLRNRNQSAMSTMERLTDGRNLYAAITNAAQKATNKFDNILNSL